MAHDAVISILLRYVPGSAGSCPQTDLLRRVDTMIVNAAAGATGDLGRTTGIESPQVLSGVFSISDLSAVLCAELLDFRLRAADSHVETRLERELCALMGARTIGVAEVRIGIPHGRITLVHPIRAPPSVWG